MCRLPLILLIAAAVSVAGDEATCDMDDANLYLSGLGIPTGLPELSLKYARQLSPPHYMRSLILRA